jgi:putative ABC transport system permease protein
MNPTFVNNAIQLQIGDLIVSAFLVLVAGIISIALRVSLEKRLLIASLRTVVQLLLVGYILKRVFEINHFLPIMGIVLVMTFFAGRSAVSRSARYYRGLTLQAFFTLFFCGLITTFTVTQGIIGVTPWFRPQYLIPLLGMILGNGLTGISLCLDQLLQSLDQQRDQVEMDLAHGASRWEAAQGPVRGAIKRGMIPVTNSMMVVGIVSIPGMMTGQILNGADPWEAVKYQIVVMFMIAGATAVGCMMMALFVYRNLFNTQHQLVAHKIQQAKKD